MTLVLATGRPPRWLDSVAEAVGRRGVAVCSNGALVYDLRQRRPIRVRPLLAEVGLAAAATVRKAVPGVSFGAEHGDSFGHEPAYRPLGDFGDLYVAELPEMFDRQVVKLLVRHDDFEVDTLASKVRQAVGELVEVTYSGHSPLIEVAAKGTSKAATLAALCAERGIRAEQVVAFGDMPNDLEMLAWAGTAYGMANAHPDVLATVRRVAPSNDADGVAVILEQLFA